MNVAERREKEGRTWRMAFLASFVLHLLLFLIGSSVTPPPVSPFSAAGPEERDDRAAEGAMQAIALRAAPPDAAQPIPIPTLEFDFPEPEIVEPEATPEVEWDEPETPEPPADGSTTGDDPEEVEALPGLPGATGAGDAGTTEEGVSRLVPPTPRGMIIPPTNQNLRGREIQVWVFVNREGRVVPDSTRLRPPTSDRRFNEQLIREAAQWVFTPAREDEEPVAAWFPYTISLR